MVEKLQQKSCGRETPGYLPSPRKKESATVWACAVIVESEACSSDHGHRGLRAALVPWEVLGWSRYVVVAVQLLSRVRLCDPMDCSLPGFPVLHCLPEFAQIHVP